MRRPLRFAATPALLGIVAGLALWNALERRPLALGTAVGAVFGVLAGIALAWRPRPLALRAAAALAIAVAGLTIAAGGPAELGDADDTVSTFLTIGLPAAGLDGLAIVPSLVVVPTVAAAVALALTGRRLLSLAASVAGFFGCCALASPTDVPRAVPFAFIGIVLVDLAALSRTHFSDLEPLAGTSTEIRRNLRWWRPLAIAVPALAIAAGAAVVPLPGDRNLRQLVDTDRVELVDYNPLAVAVRLQRAESVTEEIDVTVDVTGASPGRLRLAVLDDYGVAGWKQEASFAVTGRRLEVDGLVRDVPADATRSRVEVRDGEASSGLLAVPTAGTPVELDNADDVRYAAAAPMLLTTSGRRSIGYLTYPDLPAPSGVVSPPSGLPQELYGCPDSELLRDTAETLTAPYSSTVEQLDAISAWLKLRKLYDPQAPGGQTIASVEDFVGRDFARGNLEVYVTSYALLARCADIPTRVVVGYPAPAADSSTSYRPDQIEAWAETPMAGVGWLAVDPVPTPTELRDAFEAVNQSPPPDAGTDAPDAPDPPDEVAATAPDDSSSRWRRSLLGGLIAAAALAVSAVVWATLSRRRTIARRARVSDPATATTLAWQTLIERVHDNGVPVAAHLTARETTKATNGLVPPAVSRMMEELATVADRARFDGDHVGDDEAGLAWALTDESLRQLPLRWGARLGPIRHPRHALRRQRVTRGERRRPRRWSGEIPPEIYVREDPMVPDLPGYEVESQIGTGSTSTVYRARHLETGRTVAVKVFAVDLTNRRFDQQRFDWEARVALMVSGRPNLPEVLDFGTAANGLPYLVTKLYEHGTLFRRVQRSGPLSAGEVAIAGQQLAMALESLHQNSIVHGDVKPENVFIDDDGSMILGDLGSAWLHADGGPATAITPPYAAPEVWLGHAPTVAADIFSLGLTLMFAAAGRPPIAGTPPGHDEIVAAFGSDLVGPLLELDSRRRPRTALAAARQLGADVSEYSLVGTTVLSIPTPTLTHRPMD